MIFGFKINKNVCVGLWVFRTSCHIAPQIIYCYLCGHWRRQCHLSHFKSDYLFIFRHNGIVYDLKSTNTEINLVLKTAKLANNMPQVKIFTNVFYMVPSISHTKFQVQVLWQLFFVEWYFLPFKQKNYIS